MFFNKDNSLKNNVKNKKKGVHKYFIYFKL